MDAWLWIALISLAVLIIPFLAIRRVAGTGSTRPRSASTRRSPPGSGSCTRKGTRGVGCRRSRSCGRRPGWGWLTRCGSPTSWARPSAPDAACADDSLGRSLIPDRLQDLPVPARGAERLDATTDFPSEQPFWPIVLGDPAQPGRPSRTVSTSTPPASPRVANLEPPSATEPFEEPRPLDHRHAHARRRPVRHVLAGHRPQPGEASGSAPPCRRGGAVQEILAADERIPRQPRSPAARDTANATSGGPDHHLGADLRHAAPNAGAFAGRHRARPPCAGPERGVDDSLGDPRSCLKRNWVPVA